MSEPGNEYVERALERSRRLIGTWDYSILVNCIDNRYIRRRLTIFDIATNYGTTEGVVWYIVRKFYFRVAEEMGLIAKHLQ